MAKLNKLTRTRYRWRNIIMLLILLLGSTLFLTKNLWQNYLPELDLAPENISEEIVKTELRKSLKEDQKILETQTSKIEELKETASIEPITIKKEGLPTVTEHSSKPKKANEKPSIKTAPKKSTPKAIKSNKPPSIEDCIKNNERDLALEWDAYAGMKRTPFPILAVYNQPFDRSLPIDDSKLWHYRITDLDVLHSSGIIVGDSYEKFRKIHRSADTHFCIYELNELGNDGNLRCIPILNPVW